MSCVVLALDVCKPTIRSSPRTMVLTSTRPSEGQIGSLILSTSFALPVFCVCFLFVCFVLPPFLGVSFFDLPCVVC